MNLKLRSESALTPDFLPEDKTGFATSSTKDRAIAENLELLAEYGESGIFRFIPADWSVEQLKDARAFPFDLDAYLDGNDDELEKQLAEMDALEDEGVRCYHYLVECKRLFEESGGNKREGARESRLASRRAGRGRGRRRSMS